MSDNFGRKKSQRWVSVSKGNYNGQEWDSSDEEMDGFDHSSNPSGSKPISKKAPPLPELSNGNPTNEIIIKKVEDSQINEGTDERSSTGSASSGQKSDKETPNHETDLANANKEGANSVASEFQYSESDDDDDEEYRVPQTGYFASLMNKQESTSGNELSQEPIETASSLEDGHRNSTETKNSANVKPSLDSPKESLGDRKDSVSELESSNIQKELRLLKNDPEIGSDEFEDYSKSKGAQSDATHNSSGSDEIPQEEKLRGLISAETSSSAPSENLHADHYSSSQDEVRRSHFGSRRSNRSLSEERNPLGELHEGLSNQNTPVRSSHSRRRSVVTDASEESSTNRKSSINSSDGYEDNASFFNQYGNNSPQSSSAGGSSRSPHKGQASSPLHLRYTSKTELRPSDRAEQDSIAEEEEDVTNDKQHSYADTGVIDSDDDDDAESVIRVPKNGYYAQIMKDLPKDATKNEEIEADGSQDDAESDLVSSESGSITDSIQASRERPIDSQKVSHEGKNSGPESTNDAADDSDSVGTNEDRKKSALRQSINLGKWQPDTDATRAGFLGGAPSTSQVPDGYVIDRDGQVVDLNPSKMRNDRAISMYSDAASAWNAFPASAGTMGGDTDTVYDTKTIYDNQTIFNVPGAIVNHGTLPPLPRDVPNSARTNTFADSDSILKHLNGEKRQHSSNLKEDFSVQAPNSSEIAQLNKKTVPSMNLDAILQSRSKTHAGKISELENYSKDLNDYDSGLHTWINYALKSSASDRDYIFDDYKVNKHVKDAYAQADELGKKMTVSNTVANVNQNVSHLKRKVFSHSMKEKSKGLFSSIGIKKI
ncbi:Fyv8p LALA0_S06e00892g [Lachancea lanzarotensis]|uniref:LALA0S06e00892g1_1 n=1 Tax=Lachancea lanzarotensis TaxID=1245769 RepID=A0A0C7N3Y1_9SACH|nr:uncharacterized protein LALA0_S06e00892g [Lachancea lanzarotensis]CEP62666.1 LALA0S06e00892g1_1 [Lachancea lanzarotensis]